ncbi:shikimate dehydrogenase [candidate division KSB3 bacterium]|uniref:Shikimate dehydrogenase (NADP(+)) n=1 Tax=candidate division KSB3 bacterium TaxID=2044937 RepID=A0A9D5JT31_9BACT|nr:shikimate dehydrogenase [candidate division KSB3 bacterium]MBD3323675.1 shikimate dehydrogenase [candidate division KSB3 bacterium]
MAAQPNYKAELVGVFGHPVAENPTIVMQEAAFQAKNLHWRYLTIEVYPEDLHDAMQGLRAMNMRGINLTIPHKVPVLQYLDEVAPDAALMGAVNTVRREGDRLIGENTDGKGFLRSLREDAQVDPAEKRVVVLGAGGAARAITVELALAGAGHLTVVNRTIERGEALVSLLNESTPTTAAFVPWQGTYAIPADTDVIVNATSIGLFPDVDAKPDIDYDTITQAMIVCDVIPNPPFTPFLNEAQRRGATTLDGLGMLVYQGAIGFEMWTGVEAPVDVMHQALQQVFG